MMLLAPSALPNHSQKRCDFLFLTSSVVFLKSYSSAVEPACPRHLFNKVEETLSRAAHRLPRLSVLRVDDVFQLELVLLHEVDFPVHIFLIVPHLLVPFYQFLNQTVVLLEHSLMLPDLLSE